MPEQNNNNNSPDNKPTGEKRRRPSGNGQRSPRRGSAQTDAAAKNTEANAPQSRPQPKGRQPRQTEDQPQNQQSQAAKPQPKGGGRRPAGRPQQAPNSPAQPMEAQEQQAPAKKTQSRRGGRKPAGPKKPVVRIIPLGGLGEVGKNLTVYECQGDSFIVDCGLTFPDEGMPGVDLVIPDFTYVLENKDRIKGIFITHGHEDHIGGLAFLLKHVKFPLYGTRLTLALVEGKLKEHGLLGKVKLNVMKPGDIVSVGCMSVEFVNVNHSIPDACAFAIQTPAGVIIQTGDFKVDFTPIRGTPIDLARFGELGSKGVLALLSDSTNAERPGSTASERTVGFSFDKLFAQADKKRILVATFASNVHRLQQVIDAAVKYGRKVAVSGRSMENVVAKAMEIGYLEAPSGVMVEVDAINRYPLEKTVIITTGSQGEPMSALTRMAMGDHRKVNVTANDFIIISASPIPGNEKLVGRVVNELLKLGAEVIYDKMYDIHVSGHACQDELKMMMAVTKPKFFLPMHGEYKHLKRHADLAVSMGIPPQNMLIGDIGKVVELDGDSMKFGETVMAGKVLVDGLGVGDVGSIVLRDRKHLAEDGLIVVVTAIERATGRIISGPDIVSRGFVYVRESEDMIGRARDIARQSIQRCIDNDTREWGVFKQKVKDDVSDYLWQVTKRNPMILPVIQEI